MPRALPLDSAFPYYTIGTELGGVQLLLEARWNDRDGAWYLSIFTEAGAPIRRGIKIVLGAFLAARSVDARLPAGRFMAVDLAGTGRDATVDDLGSRVQVQWWSTAELQELAA